ncbi:MAG: ABC transporter permease [Candidatus Fimadaptatus sp.]|jgi:putative aldouronate transport system permease protein
MAQQTRGAARMHSSGLGKRIWRDRYLYLLLLPVVVYFFVFKYAPLYGLQIAFKDFKMNLGITGSEWVGMKYFNRLFNSAVFFRVFRNTLLLNLYNLLWGFPAPIILALMLNEMRSQSYKRVAQSIVYIPHFFSWVVLAGMVDSVLSPSTGIVNMLYKAITGAEEGIYFLASNRWWRTVFVIVNIWKEVGWGTIIYLAAMSGVDPQLYEAAIIDGATKFQQMYHITLPSIRPTIVILLVLRMGSMMDVGMEPVLLLSNDVVREVSDVFSTYIYRQGIQSTQYSLTTAMGIFQSVISTVLLLSANFASNKLTGEGIW